MSNKKVNKKPNNNSGENIFDLSKIVSSTNDIEISNNNSPENLLDGYELVPHSDWVNLKYNTHIRYLNKDGAMRRGGFVKKIWSKTDKMGAIYLVIDLVANFAKNGSSWSISSNKVEKIWKKIGSGSNEINIVSSKYDNISNSELETIKEDIEYCKGSIQHMIAEIQNLKNEQLRIVELIRKLHNIK